MDLAAKKKIKIKWRGGESGFQTEFVFNSEVPGLFHLGTVLPVVSHDKELIPFFLVLVVEEKDSDELRQYYFVRDCYVAESGLELVGFAKVADAVSFLEAFQGSISVDRRTIRAMNQLNSTYGIMNILANARAKNQHQGKAKKKGKRTWRQQGSENGNINHLFSQGNRDVN